MKKIQYKGKKISKNCEWKYQTIWMKIWKIAKENIKKMWMKISSNMNENNKNCERKYKKMWRKISNNVKENIKDRDVLWSGVS